MNVNCRILLPFALLETFVCQSGGKLIVKPETTDAKVNHSTYFNCSTDFWFTEIFWFHGGKVISKRNVILEPYKERFKIDKTVWNRIYVSNLVIHPVQPGDAGQYICAEDEGYGEQYSVQLVVLDDDPICRSNVNLNEVIGQNTCNIEPDEVKLECSVTYHGNIPPQLEWRKVGQNSPTPSVSTVTSGNNFVSTLKLKGDIVINNSSYVCEAMRTTAEPKKCITKVINVLYAQSDNSTVINTIDDEIYCKANTTQSCLYKWKWLQDDDVTVESSTSVLKAKKSGYHRCEAEYQMRNKTCNLLVMQAIIHEYSQPTNAFIVALVVTLVVAIIDALVVFIVWRTCRRRNNPGLHIYFPRRIRRSKEDDDSIDRDDISPNKNESDITDENDITDESDITDDRQFHRGIRRVCCRRWNHLTLECCTERRPEEESEEEIELINKQRGVVGLSVLHQELFISRVQRPDIEVYDSTTFDFKRRITVGGMIFPANIASCTINNCLYAFDWNYRGLDPAILRIDPINGNLITAWIVSNGFGGLISIAGDTNVILCIFRHYILLEYTADGELVRTIKLGDIYGASHAVKHNSGQFAVGYISSENRVCLISTKTIASNPVRIDEVEILKEFHPFDKFDRNVWSGSEYVTVGREGSILVSDTQNKQTVLLSSNLDNPLILISKEHGLKTSWRSCFDESTNRWFVTDFRRIMVCRVDGERVEREICHVNSD